MRQARKDHYSTGKMRDTTCVGRGSAMRVVCVCVRGG
jgi:hypothetical protein